MMTTKRHVQGRKGRAAMELGKQRFVKQAHLEKEEREQTKFEAAWAAAKLVHETRMVVNAFRMWRAVQGAAKAAVARCIGAGCPSGRILYVMLLCQANLVTLRTYCTAVTCTLYTVQLSAVCVDLAIVHPIK